jgi:hypothetical protein
MFQLYKVRNFSALINDTLSFFKVQGKNYLKHYFVLNGGLLLILTVLCFVVGRVFFENIFSGLNNPGSQNFIEQYFADNQGFFIGAGIAGAILILVIAIINYAYPVVYLSLLEKNDAPTIKQITSALKKKLGKVILFVLLTLITFVPLAIPIGLFCMFLTAIIIGLPVAIIIIAAFSCWIYLTFYNYISTDDSYFTSMGRGWNMLFRRFWHHMGSTVIIFIIVQAIQFIFSMIPYIIGLVFIFIDGPGNGNIEEQEGVLSTIGILMLVVFTVSLLTSFIMGNLLAINQGMIYYSCIEEDENKTINNEIDLIGESIE